MSFGENLKESNKLRYFAIINSMKQNEKPITDRRPILIKLRKKRIFIKK